MKQTLLENSHFFKICWTSYCSAYYGFVLLHSSQYRHWFTSEIQFYIIRTSNCSVLWKVFLEYDNLPCLYLFSKVHTFFFAGEWCFEITKCHEKSCENVQNQKRGKTLGFSSVFSDQYTRKRTQFCQLTTKRIEVRK